MSEPKYHAAIKDADLSEGKMRGVYIRGKPILLARVNGQVYAMENRCPHQGCQFQNGILTDTTVMCPCHGWKFNLKNGQPQQNPPTPLPTYPTKTQNGKIHVGFQ